MQNNDHWYSHERQFARQHHIKVIVIPMQTDVPPTAAQSQQFLNIVTNPANQPILVHCAQGKVRTQMMVTAYRVSVLKQTPQQVLEQLPWFYHHPPLQHHRAALNFIRHYQPQLVNR